MLVRMELVASGSGPFLGRPGYVLFPSVPCFLNGSLPAYPFGLLADLRELHLFQEMQDLRWASCKINKILHLSTAFRTRMQVLAHVLYRVLPPAHTRLRQRSGRGLAAAWDAFDRASVATSLHLGR